MQGQKLPGGGDGGPGELRVVATPIGNLSDVSARVRDSFAWAEVAFCEDTRRTQQLCRALGIPTPALERLDAHAAPAKLDAAAERLARGARGVLVTDAGTPGVSDPGAALVERALGLGVRVSPIPGPSAVAALVSVSGFSGVSFVFRGFFPRSAGERAREVALCASSPVSQVFAWFESPERVVSALAALAESAPEGTRCVAAKELTKLHERLFPGSVAEVEAAVRAEIDREGARGEWAFVVCFPTVTKDEEAEAPESLNWNKALELLLEANVSPSDAARSVSQTFAVGKKRVYEAALCLSRKKSPRGG